MIRFNSDYTEGACPEILERMLATNMEQTPGYGEDEHCKRASEYIKKECQAPDAAIHFLVGGTQTNFTVISAALRTHQGAIAAETGHINVHETGAVEACGHKVLALPSKDGKITAAQVKEYVDRHRSDESFEHIVQPKMVYISNPTELGTLYTKAELAALAEVCRQEELYLFLDGARLGYGLCAKDNDVTLADLARYCDVFYIGGTKVGALFGEAVVITNDELKKDFRYIIKQHGGMLAKGRLLGIQFETLFEDGLYFRVSKHAIEMADKLRDGLMKMNVEFLADSPTNQLFPIFEDSLLEALKKGYAYTYMERVDEHRSAIRFCTCWATKEENVDALLNDIKKLLGR